MDNNYWKNAYKDLWGESSKREEYMAQWITENTGLNVEIVGLGAGTNDFISGSANENGYEKGDADLHIINTDVYVEVTGPLSSNVSIYSPLWFRPDKFNNAVRNSRIGHDTFFAHHCPSQNLWRIIHIDSELIDRLFKHEFKVVHPFIRGKRETYVEVPANDECIQPLEYLKQYLLEKYG